MYNNKRCAIHNSSIHEGVEVGIILLLQMIPWPFGLQLVPTSLDVEGASFDTDFFKELRKRPAHPQPTTKVP